MTKKDRYPLPRIDEMLEDLRGAKYFTKMDLRAGYWQIPLRLADREKTAFITEDGLYQFKRMPFGLTNAPATFQRLVDHLAAPLRRVYAYIDDVEFPADDVIEML